MRSAKRCPPRRWAPVSSPPRVSCSAASSRRCSKHCAAELSAITTAPSAAHGRASRTPSRVARRLVNSPVNGRALGFVAVGEDEEPARDLVAFVLGDELEDVLALFLA